MYILLKELYTSVYLLRLSYLIAFIDPIKWVALLTLGWLAKYLIILVRRTDWTTYRST